MTTRKYEKARLLGGGLNENITPDDYHKLPEETQNRLHKDVHLYCLMECKCLLKATRGHTRNNVVVRPYFSQLVEPNTSTNQCAYFRKYSTGESSEHYDAKYKFMDETWRNSIELQRSCTCGNFVKSYSLDSRTIPQIEYTIKSWSVDVALLGPNRQVVTVIEILHTHKVNGTKRQYLRDATFQYFEVKASDVLNKTTIPVQDADGDILCCTQCTKAKNTYEEWLRQQLHEAAEERIQHQQQVAALERMQQLQKYKAAQKKIEQERLQQERKEAQERLQQERKEAQKRLQHERKEAQIRLQQERKEAQERLQQERKEAQKRLEHEAKQNGYYIRMALIDTIFPPETKQQCCTIIQLLDRIQSLEIQMFGSPSTQDTLKERILNLERVAGIRPDDPRSHITPGVYQRLGKRHYRFIST